MRNITLVTVLAACLAVVGCASDKKKRSGSRSGGGSTSSSSTYGGGPSAGAGDESSIVGGAAGAGAAGMPTEKVVYFDLDSADLKPESQATVTAWAQYLAANPSTKLRLEGHCDERGTREYNIGLGERRSNAVLQALTAQGASAKQLSAASFGEERPVALGHDEAAWAQNRRVEIVQ